MGTLERSQEGSLRKWREKQAGQRCAERVSRYSWHSAARNCEGKTGDVRGVIGRCLFESSRNCRLKTDIL